MTQQEKEKMFLYLNDVLVKFWIEQDRPDKEVRIELLERMLNWYKKMANVTLDEQSKEPANDDLENAARNYTDSSEWLIGENLEHLDNAFKAGAEWQKEQMMKGALDGVIDYETYGIIYLKQIITDKKGKVKDLRIWVNTKPLENHKNYTIATNSFIAQGRSEGAIFKSIPDDKKTEVGTKNIRQLIEEGLRKGTRKEPIKPGPEGRVAVR